MERYNESSDVRQLFRGAVAVRGTAGEAKNESLQPSDVFKRVAAYCRVRRQWRRSRKSTTMNACVTRGERTSRRSASPSEKSAVVSALKNCIDEIDSSAAIAAEVFRLPA